MAALTDPAALGRLDLFRRLSTSDLGRINDQLGTTKFPAGAMIFTADQPGEIAYIVLEGTLKVSVLQANGQELTLALLGPGELVGEMAVADRQRRSADVVAIEPALLLWVDRAAFDRLRRELPQVTENLLALMARRLRLTNAQLLALASLDVHGRVARQLLALADAYGEQTPAGMRIPLRLTQSDLAGLVGATRVRVNEVLVGFKRRGFVEVDGRYRVTVRDRAALADYIA
ncbi:MAG: Crp/Fnr family transcriptional regulator [Thermomicrobiales bacterium]|nr:Crp/Fnr family transcriptional regulator [Thermomicrobiales bacterium]